ncbi:alpha/beta fold hydrolase [Streptomyces sudanensis]|uniref:alpha/beta fold hydrolase n=1 Tax=Streptomyces sudanensis TaxID=436397 RepID=UPI0020CB7186|nr:alpha/beta hydrolase [Streptomyces sudanensis]MCP9956638.1 alpha/beta hydrolase [Streptomyces sudanensis]MCQ0002757.1 alpha/beta hydrolase [Streptomyces sudanensis]
MPTTAPPDDRELAASLDGDFTSDHADLGDVRLHYVSGGRGEPLFLLPGWPETWWEYRKVMPTLAKRFRVVAVDIRGMGGSSKPAGGYDKKTMAGDIRALARHLGYERINVAGHGIGSMVAFSHAANHPEATIRLAVLNTTHIDDSYHEFRIMPRPGDPGPHRWWLAFNLVPEFPEKVLSGRYRHMVDHMFGLSLLNPDAVPPRDRDVYARAYDSPEAIRASQAWFQAYQQDIEDFRGYGRLTVPVLGLAYGPFHDYMAEKLPEQGTDVRVREIKGTRNYLVEEQPEAVASEFLRFFG